MLNPYEHDDADALAQSVQKTVPVLEELVARWSRDDRDHLVYVNDNYGDWSADATTISKRAIDGRHPELVEPILPEDDLSFVTKARHTAFYGTPLEYLLRDKGVSEVVLTGQVTEQCILYSALDAYVRHFEVAVVRDAVATIEPELGDAALAMMERNMSAQVVAASDCEPS
jgi:nicotinamidase-related amidase